MNYLLKISKGYISKHILMQAMLYILSFCNQPSDQYNALVGQFVLKQETWPCDVGPLRTEIELC